MSLTEKVVAAVRREIRDCGMLNEPTHWLPPPCDLDAEGEVLSARLNGHVLAIELAPLDARHFFGDLNREIWRATEEVAPGDFPGVFRVLTTRGWRGAIAQEVHTLTAAQPFSCLRRLREHADRLIDLWRQRQVIELARHVELELRRGNLTAAQAVEQFRSRTERLFGAPLKAVGE